MKLLFDENLSPKLPRLLVTQFPNSLHVRDIDMKGFADEMIGDYVKNNSFTLISKDADFYQRALLYGHPPKFIWLRIGNCDRDTLLRLITINKQKIEYFLNNSERMFEKWEGTQ